MATKLPESNSTITDHTPHFAWTHFTIGWRDAAYYTLFVSTDAGFTDRDSFTYLFYPDSSYTLTAQEELSSGKYYWKVRLFLDMCAMYNLYDWGHAEDLTVRRAATEGVSTIYAIESNIDSFTVSGAEDHTPVQVVSVGIDSVHGYMRTANRKPTLYVRFFDEDGSNPIDTAYVDKWPRFKETFEIFDLKPEWITVNRFYGIANDEVEDAWNAFPGTAWAGNNDNLRWTRYGSGGYRKTHGSGRLLAWLVDGGDGYLTKEYAVKAHLDNGYNVGNYHMYLRYYDLPCTSYASADKWQIRVGATVRAENIVGDNVIFLSTALTGNTGNTIWYPTNTSWKDSCFATFDSATIASAISQAPSPEESYIELKIGFVGTDGESGTVYVKDFWVSWPGLDGPPVDSSYIVGDSLLVCVFDSLVADTIYPIPIKIIDDDGNTTDTTIFLTIAPDVACTTTITPNGISWDGQEQFPMGLFQFSVVSSAGSLLTVETADSMSSLADIGFNAAHHFLEGTELKRDAFFRACSLSGLKIWGYPIIRRSGEIQEYQFVRPSCNLRDSVSAIYADIMKRTLAASKHTNFLCYNLSDEGEATYRLFGREAPVDCEAALEYLWFVDPHHFAVMWPWCREMTQWIKPWAYREGVGEYKIPVIFQPQNYYGPFDDPNGKNRNYQNVLYGLPCAIAEDIESQRVYSDFTVPIISAIGAFGRTYGLSGEWYPAFSWGNEPGYMELISQVFMALIHNARGLLFYGYFGQWNEVDSTYNGGSYNILDSPRHQLELIRKVAHIVNDYAWPIIKEGVDVLASESTLVVTIVNDTTRAYDYNGDLAIHTRLILSGKHYYLFVANARGHSIDVAFDSLNTSYPYAYDLANKTRVAISNHRIRVVIEPYGVRLYQFPGGQPAAYFQGVGKGAGIRLGG